VTRDYRKSARADSEQETRRRILDAAIAAMAEAHTLGVRDIAKAAAVTVQTVYAHFGSKSGLVMAVVATVSEQHGLPRSLAAVRRQEDAVAALTEMARVTFSFWHRAWPFIRFSLTARRVDAVYAEQMQSLDDSRLRDLETICQRLHAERRLQPGLSARTAASLVFALTSPQVYEELVASGRLAFPTAARLVRAAVLDAVVAG
jgi:AcrR family transcriptional regulator